MKTTKLATSDGMRPVLSSRSFVMAEAQTAVIKSRVDWAVARHAAGGPRVEARNERRVGQQRSPRAAHLTAAQPRVDGKEKEDDQHQRARQCEEVQKERGRVQRTRAGACWQHRGCRAQRLLQCVLKSTVRDNKFRSSGGSWKVRPRDEEGLKFSAREPFPQIIFFRDESTNDDAIRHI